MARFVEVFDTWHRGDWGNLGAFKAGRLEDGFFKASNMLVYDDGSIGPRPGIKDRALTGLPNGVLWGMGYNPFGVGTHPTWMIVNGQFWAGDTAMTQATGDVLAATPTKRVRHKESTRALVAGRTYFATDNGGVYWWAPSSNVLTEVTTTVTGVDYCLYRDRMYVAGEPATGERVLYSDAADPNTWDSALQYFDVGYAFDHYHIFPHRNSLVFLTQEYQWILSGVPESTSTLRRSGESIPASRYAAIQSRDEIWYIPQTRSAPVRWGGGIGDEKSLEYLEWTTATARDFFGAAKQIKTDDILFISNDNKSLLRHNDVWTIFDWETSVHPICSRYGVDRFQLTDGGDVAAAPVSYWFMPELNRPGFVSDTYAQPGDDSTTPVDAYLYLPEWWHPRGYEVKVQAVEVDFVSWDTGTSEPAHFDLSVVSTRPHAIGSPTEGTSSSQSQPFNESVSLSSTSGTDRRQRFNFGDQGWGRGYQIRFDNIRSVSIRSVSVIVDDEPRDSR